MNLEAQGVSEESLGFLKGCLVEGDPAQERRARKLKRRALAISILLQFAFVTALVLFPLLGKGERISLKDMTPIPPYSFSTGHRPENVRPNSQQNRAVCRFCPPPSIPGTIALSDNHELIVDSNEPEPIGPNIPGVPSGPSIPGALTASNPSTGPARPLEPPRQMRVHVGTIEPALLAHRVEPLYPALARQLRLGGRVELHAIISTDGSIQSLEVTSGHPLFIQSALEAVRQWRYRPTILNGHAVEVDTHITVIYSLN